LLEGEVWADGPVHMVVGIHLHRDVHSMASAPLLFPIGRAAAPSGRLDGQRRDRRPWAPAHRPDTRALIQARGRRGASRERGGLGLQPRVRSQPCAHPGEVLGHRSGHGPGSATRGRHQSGCGRQLMLVRAGHGVSRSGVGARSGACACRPVPPSSDATGSRTLPPRQRRPKGATAGSCGGRIGARLGCRARR
jgi:hypothetical protein